MNTTNRPKKNITNYVKLSQIVLNSMSELKHNDELMNKTRDFRHIKPVGAFNCLIATGYYNIAYNTDVDLIKKNFDFTGSNKDVLLDFNLDKLNEICKTSDKPVSSDVQGVLY